jgi:hypothetical protein
MVSKGAVYGTTVFGTILAVGGVAYALKRKKETAPAPGVGEPITVVGPPHLQPKGTTVFTKRDIGW